MSAYLAALSPARPTGRCTKRQANRQASAEVFAKRANRVEEYARGFMMDGGTLFEELGFYYVGPIDGHNLDHLLPVLRTSATWRPDRSWSMS